MDKWYLLLKSAIEGDRQGGVEHSTSLGYLIGGENEVSQNHGDFSDFTYHDTLLPNPPTIRELYRPWLMLT